MRYNHLIKLVIGLFCLFCSAAVSAQLRVLEINDAQLLAQKLVGNGIIISNAKLTISPSIIPTGFFNNIDKTNIGIDSGIVLTCGRAKSTRTIDGLDGTGNFMANIRLADNDLGLPGDTTLANELGIPVTDLYDAIALEFDFIPLGDSIKFKYVLSSEEYTEHTVCQYNDAFGFFISGPGIVGNKNIALVPGTSTPVTITNVNDIAIAGCVNNPQYYIDNSTNTYFNHNGHTTVLIAKSKVQPCQTYHLKLVVSDQGDHAWDTGVFLEAKSLTSDAIGLNNLIKTDKDGNNYLAEGCSTGSFTIRRTRKDPFPSNVMLTYTGTAINGIDVQQLPSSVIIPANDNLVTVDVIPVIDGISEGIETLKVYALANCIGGTPSDSITFQVRDYDTLSITPLSSAICKNSSLQLNAISGYTSYQWNNTSTLSSLIIRNPVATPAAPSTIYICTATDGMCYRRDSVEVKIIPPVKVYAGRDTIAAFGQPIQLHAYSQDPAVTLQYSWSSPHFLLNPNSDSPIANPPSDYQFVVTGTTTDGCKTTDDIIIKVYKGPELYIPSAFTPNNDGLNDLLKIVPVGIKEFRLFRIFNRAGQIVFETRNAAQSWDGKLNGIEQQTGSYVWMAEALDYKNNIIIRKGIVTIIR